MNFDRCMNGLRSLGVTLALALALFVVATTTPATATTTSTAIAQSPLFVGTNVPPNIMVVLDDSGSMAWADLPTPGAEQAYGSQGHISLIDYSCLYYGYGYGYGYEDGGEQGPCYSGQVSVGDYTKLLPAGKRVQPYSPAEARAVRRLSCYGFNSLAYNPNETYVPWVGTDSQGQPFQNQSVTAARVNPMEPTPTINLSDQVFFPWHDTNGNGSYNGPGATNAEAPASSSDECGNVSSDKYGVKVSSLSAAQQTNYANWYTYYHTRERMAKAALSQVIGQSDARVGLATINDNSAPVAVKNLTVGDNRANLLSALFQVTPGGGTPLRMALDDDYRYFEVGGHHGDYGALGLNPDWPSPILPQSEGGECQQNFQLLMTDGYWNGYYPWPSWDDWYYGSPPGNADGDNDSPFDGGSYADPYSNTLADVAMRAYESDLAPSLPNDVPTQPGVDENDAQHLVTFTVGLGLNGTLTGNPANTTQPFVWPKPMANTATTVDDLRHAAWDGRGQYLNAHNQQSLLQSLESDFASIRMRTGTAAAVSFSGSSLTDGTHLFQSLFSTDGWTGDVEAYPLNPSTGAVGQPLWSASQLLDQRSAASRTILTDNAGTGVPFEWSDVSTAMQDDLNTAPDGASDGNGAARLAFLRGDRANEGHGLGFRVRMGLLGDIVHSSPVFVGKPDLNWPDQAPFPTAAGQTYSDFVSAEANRTPMLYVGANDGMLHAFNADTGQEAFAYVPSNLASTAPDAGLHYLTNPKYGHHYYVDATPTVSDAYIQTAGESAPSWHSVLVGGEGAGGRGLFALDVTHPDQVSQSNAAQTLLWQFTQQDDADLGYTFSRPVIAKLNNGRWAAIVGNGPGGASGQAELFIIYLDGGQNGRWVEGKDYIKIDTDDGTSTNPDALFSPAVVDLDGNGTADRVYAGDSQGNVWAFDLSSKNSAQWSVAYRKGNTPEPLFQGGASYPITAAPVVAAQPLVQGGHTASDPNVMVYVGSGAYYRDSDKTDTTAQRFYGLWDHGTPDLTTANLVQQTIVQGAFSALRVVSNNPVTYVAGSSTSEDGWYLTLTSGERVTGQASIRGSTVFFNTDIPSTSPCTGGGSGYLMALDLADGGRTAQPAFDTNGDQLLNQQDYVTGPNGDPVVASGKRFDDGLPGAAAITGSYRYTSGTGSPAIVKDKINLGLGAPPTGRIGWMQLLR